MTPSRRDFLKGCGALIVSFSAAPLTNPRPTPRGNSQPIPGTLTRTSSTHGCL